MTTDELNTWEQAIKDHGVEDMADDVLRLIAIARAAIAFNKATRFTTIHDIQLNGVTCRYCSQFSDQVMGVEHASDCPYAAFVKAVKD